jgi:glutathionylspermidine synthase
VSLLARSGSNLNIWYEQEVAYEKSQKYKEGKFILERYALLPS